MNFKLKDDPLYEYNISPDFIELTSKDKDGIYKVTVNIHEIICIKDENFSNGKGFFYNAIVEIRNRTITAHETYEEITNNIKEYYVSKCK